MTRKKGGSKKKSGPKPQAANGAPTASGASAAEAPEPGLALTIVAPAAFWNAVTEDECPASIDVDLEQSPAPDTAPGTVAASEVEGLLKWFAKGVAAPGAGTARIGFAASLSKEERAAVHSTIAAAGLGAALESASEGVGEARRISVYRKGAAPVRPAPDPELLERAATLYKWARDAGLTSYSRDEIAEQLAAGPDGAGLAAPLAALWAARSVEQADVGALSRLVEADDAAGVAELLGSKPGLVRAVDSHTGQPPLHAAARLGAVAALRALVAAGAGLEEKDAHGRTALQVSRTFEQCDAEAALLQLGAHDPEAGKLPFNKAAAELAAKPAKVAEATASKPASEAPKAEAPKAEAAKAEAPKAEAAKAEAAKAEAPKAEAAKAEAPKAKAAKAEAAKAEAPKAEAAKAEAPKAEATEAEAPKAEAAKAEAPKAAKAEAPKAEAPKPAAEKAEAKPTAAAAEASTSAPPPPAAPAGAPAAPAEAPPRPADVDVRKRVAPEAPNSPLAAKVPKGAEGKSPQPVGMLGAAAAPAAAPAQRHAESDASPAPAAAAHPPQAASASPVDSGKPTTAAAVAESAGTSAATVGAAAGDGDGGLRAKVKALVSEGKAWAQQNAGFLQYAGVTALFAGLTSVMLSLRRRS